MKDKLNITVRLADCPPIPLYNVTMAEEETIRQAEYNINRLWQSWRLKFKEKSPQEILAMVTLRFARLYFSNLQSVDTINRMLADFEKELDNSLIEIDSTSHSDTDSGAQGNL